jgi:hypothetical protein
MTLTRAQADQVKSAVARGRAGRATLPELAAALDLSASGGLPGCAGELRGHLLRKLGTSSRTSSMGRDVVLGLATGALTHYLLRGL